MSVEVLPVFACIGETEASFLSSALLAAKSASFKLKNLAIRYEWELAQISWDSSFTGVQGDSHPYGGNSKARLEKKIINSAKAHLVKRGEPAPYIILHAASLVEICTNDHLINKFYDSPGDFYSEIHTIIEEVFSSKNGFSRFGGGEKSLETSNLWHDELIHHGIPLADRIENAGVEFLISEKTSTIPVIDEHLCKEFPGLFTPDSGLIRLCLESYTQQTEENSKPSLRVEDYPETRWYELEAIQRLLFDLGKRLGYEPRGETPQIWYDEIGQPKFVYYLMTSSSFGEVVISNPFPPNQSFLVIPGARANLAMYKIHHNPLLREDLEKGWRILKYRHIRHLCETPTVTRENLDELLNLDPLTETPAQMRLL
jgi:hypothetical protein